MSLLRKIIEDAAAGATGAMSVSGVPTSLLDKSKKNKKKAKTKMIKRSLAEAGKVDGESFDEEDVLSKLKDSSKSFEKDIDTVGFALEDSDGNMVKVFVVADQATDFENALSHALDDSEQSKAEIAEILFNFRDEFDIIDIVWGSIPEDEEVNNELADKTSDATDETGLGDATDETGLDAASSDLGIGDSSTDMTSDSSSGDASVGSALDKVIDMMKADADARKAEANAKKAAADADSSKYAAQASAEKVKAEEEILDMETYYKSKNEEDKEAKRLAKLAKYKHDLAADEQTDSLSMEGFIRKGGKNSLLQQVYSNLGKRR